MSVEPFQDRDAAWRKLVELRSQREIVERWLQAADMPEQLREQLQIMLGDIEGELSRLEPVRRPTSVPRRREAS